jgi:hypothetical protein
MNHPSLIRKALIVALIMQTRKKKCMYGHYYQTRFNPYNPLSYAFWLFCAGAGMFLVGFNGMKEESFLINRFSWQ